MDQLEQSLYAPANNSMIMKTILRGLWCYFVVLMLSMQGPPLDDGSDDDNADNSSKKSRNSSRKVGKVDNIIREAADVAKRYQPLPDDGTPADLVKVGGLQWPRGQHCYFHACLSDQQICHLPLMVVCGAAT